MRKGKTGGTQKLVKLRVPPSQLVGVRSTVPWKTEQLDAIGICGTANKIGMAWQHNHRTHHEAPGLESQQAPQIDWAAKHQIIMFVWSQGAGVTAAEKPMDALATWKCSFTQHRFTRRSFRYTPFSWQTLQRSKTNWRKKVNDLAGGRVHRADPVALKIVINAEESHGKHGICLRTDEEKCHCDQQGLRCPSHQRCRNSYQLANAVPSEFLDTGHFHTSPASPFFLPKDLSSNSYCIILNILNGKSIGLARFASFMRACNELSTCQLNRYTTAASAACPVLLSAFGLRARAKLRK